jgi:tryptophanyl-tRNA synthetase
MRALKEKVADTVDMGISDIRQRYHGLMSGDQKELVQYAEEGARKAEEIAESTMQRVRKAMGMAW